MTQHRLYGQCSLVNICLCSSFETSRQFLRGSFSLGKRNDIRQGLASSHVNSQWLVNPRRIVPEKTQWKWTRGMWQDSCDARFLWKRPGMWKRSDASHINLQSHWTQDVFYLKKHSESGRVPATHVLVEKRYGIRERWVVRQMNLQSEGTQDAFYLKKHKESGGVGRARIFHGKTQESVGVGHPLQKNLQSRWRPGAVYMRKHKDFSAVGRTGTYMSRKFTVEMKARRVLHEKTQRFLRGRQDGHAHVT